MRNFNHKLAKLFKFRTGLQSFAKKGCVAFVSVEEEGKRMKREVWLQLAPVKNMPMNLNSDIKATWRQWGTRGSFESKNRNAFMSWRETRSNSQDATWPTSVIKHDFLRARTSKNRRNETDVAHLPRIPNFGRKYLFKSLLISSDLMKLKKLALYSWKLLWASSLYGSVVYFVLILVSQTIKCGGFGCLKNDAFGSV